MLLHPSPGEGTKILLVVEFDDFAAAPHQFICDFLIIYREVEDVGLYSGVPSGLRSCPLETGLDYLSFIGLPDRT